MCYWIFTDKREKKVYEVLEDLSQQRVAIIRQPGDVWVIENSVSEKNEGVAEALRTCHLRGWVEVVEDAVPEKQLNQDGTISDEPARNAPFYRLTEAGWNVINRTYTLQLSTFIIVFLTFIISLIGVSIRFM